MKTDILDILKNIESDRRIDLKIILVSLVFVSLMRILIETMLGVDEFILSPTLSNFVFVFSFYGFALLLYAFVLSLCSKRKPIEVARVLTPFLAVALLVPVIDFLVSGYPIIGYHMSKISNFDIFRISANNPFGESVILWSIPVMSAIYVFFQRKSVKRSFATFVAVFLAPIFLTTNIADFLGLGTNLYHLYATVASTVLLLLMFYIQNDEKFGKLFTRFYERMNRIILYIIIFVFGIATVGNVFATSFLGIYILILLIISFVAMCVNDYFDFPLDKANGKNNLLESLTKEDLKNVIIVSFLVLVPFLTFIFESIKNVMLVYYMVSIISLLFLYSYKNFIKGILLLNYLVDSLSYSITFMAGRSLIVAQGQMELAYFIMATLIFFLIIPIKDHGDLKGDTKLGIKNFYTVFGPKKAFRLCKVLLFVAFVIFSLCFLYVMPFKNLLGITIFYVIPSIVMLPLMVFRFKKTENLEMSIWLIDALLLIYLIPFLS
jgi:4-hydroxybenzoate polyprenyltransferase